MKYKIFDMLISFLLPKGELLYKVDNFEEATLEKKLSLKKIKDAPLVEALFSYKDEDIRNLIHAFKYHRRKNISEMFGKFLYEHILADLGEDMYLTHFKDPILMPIPISKNRLRERGFNQAEIIVRETLKHDNENICSMLSDVLIKKNDKRHQAHAVSRREREKNIKNSFYVQNAHKIKDKNIILIDDVITTGATVREARRVLIEAGAKDVRALAIAH